MFNTNRGDDNKMPNKDKQSYTFYLIEKNAR